MASYSDLGQLTLQTNFQNRVRVALFLAAVSAYTENVDATGHAARSAYAVKVLNGQYDILSAAYAVLTNPTISGEATADGAVANNGIPDGDLQFSMNSVYNGLAGA